MIYSIHIKSAPYQNQACRSALRFVEALIRKEHSINQVFFSGEAVVIATLNAVTPSDEECLQSGWVSLSTQNRFALNICSAAAVRRGVMDEKSAESFSKSAPSLVDGYAIAGLGQFVESIANSDRVVTFG